MADKKNPSTLIFWNDLENDEDLKTCSLAAKGLWDHHMLPIAARSGEPGVVICGNHPSRIDDDLPLLLARAVGEAPEVIVGLLRELVDGGAASVDENGRVYNRRMVREEAIRRARSEAGKRGADATNSANLDRRQNSGKGVGKTGGKPSGKGVGKTDDAKDDLSHGKHGVISDTGGNVSRQNPGKASGAPAGKTAPSSLLHASDSISVTTTESSLERPEVDGSAATAQPDELARAVEIYNATAERIGWAKIKKLGPDRSSALKARLKEWGGIESWCAAMARAEASSFLNGTSRPGNGHENWRPDFDFFLMPKRFRKLMEGGYDNPDRQNVIASSTRGTGKVGTVARNIIGAAVFARPRSQGSDRDGPEQVDGADVHDTDRDA